MHNYDRTKSSLVVVFVDDLMMSTKIESVCKYIGFDVQFVEESYSLPFEETPRTLPITGEPVTGQAAVLIDNLTTWQPGLLIFDLGDDAIPWERLIAILKSSPATRRIPVLCFGPHVDTQKMSIALNLAVDSVVSRSRFVRSMPELIEKYARVWDKEILVKSCKEPLSPKAFEGLQAFNSGQYFESHEYLEDAWNEDTSPTREIFRAILQVAVAYLQIERANYRGAIKMFLRARQWLAPLPDNCRGINLAKLKSDAELVYKALVEVGPKGIENFDHDLFQPIEYKSKIQGT